MKQFMEICRCTDLQGQQVTHRLPLRRYQQEKIGWDVKLVLDKNPYHYYSDTGLFALKCKIICTINDVWLGK